MSLSQSTTIRKRIFVTGASRSGTTLLQSLLAGHSRIHTFPETGAFLKILGMRRRTPWAMAGLSLGREKKALRRLYHAFKPENFSPSQLDTCLSLKSSTEQIVAFLDHLTLEQNKDIWVEKTPRHFKYADVLLRYVPRTHILHILRDGRDVVTSIYLRAMRHPDKFNKQRYLKYGVQLWNEAVRKAYALQGTPGHTTLFYEDLTQSPESVVRFVCNNADIAFEPNMLCMSQDHYFIQSHEAWKRNSSTHVVSNTSKFTSVFDLATREWLEDKLYLNLYRRLRRTAALRGELAEAPQAIPCKETATSP